MGEVSITCAREAAFAALLSCEKQGAWSDQAIRSASKKLALSPRDAALAANICYGIVQNRLLLDFWIDCFSTRKAEQLDREVRIALWMGLYQLRFLDRVPERAAVNESVNLARKYARNKKGAGGLVNAVLRAFQRAGDTPPQPKGKTLERLSILYSHPLPLVRLFAGELGEETLEPLLRADNAAPDMVIQVNTLRTDAVSLQKELTDAGITAEPHPWMPDCFLVQGSGDLEKLDAFQTGKFYVQDSAAKLAALVSGAKPGDRVLDACAAPGGKSFACAIQMDGQGEILSRDLQEKKLNRIRSGARRLGLNCIRTAAADGRVYDPALDAAFDIVLADVPCSGLGIIRKKPDIRYKDLKGTEALPQIQYDILNNVSRFVRPGGVLVYSTCTVLSRENAGVVSAFLAEHPSFTLEPFTIPGQAEPCPGMRTLWPHLDEADGFFVAKLRRGNDPK